MADFAVIGKQGNLDKQGKMIVTGRLDYCADIFPDKKLFTRILTSPHPHARIVSIDTSKAMQLEGVKGVLTYEAGFPATNFLFQELTWWGQEVAIVAATDPNIAEDALDLIEVEYETLPFVVHPDDAMEPDAPLVGCWPDGNVHTGEFLRGNFEAGFEDADVTVEDTVGWTNFFQQSNIETRGATVWWLGDDVYVQIPSPNVWMARMLLSMYLGMSMHKIHIVSHGSGGILGDKIMPGQGILAAAMLSKQLGQPVCTQNTRREYFLTTQHQHRAKATIKIGCKNDGTITAIDCTYYGDDGGLGSSWASGCTYPIMNTLRCADGRFAYVEIATNSPWAYIYRSVNNPPGDFCMEVVLDKMAEELGMTPLEFRQKNYVRPDEVQQDNGKPYASNSVLECLNTAANTIGFTSKWHEPGTKTLADGRLHGIGIASSVENHGTMSSPVGAIVNMTKDGKCLLDTGITRVGCGTQSALCAIVAETIGLSYEDVAVGEWGNTDISAEAQAQWGSMGTINNGAAHLNAAKDARDQILERAAGILGVPVGDLDIGGGMVWVKADDSISTTIAAVVNSGSPIVGRGYGWPSVLQREHFGWPAGTPCETRCMCATAVEVAVDPDTGEVEVLDIVDVVDAGRVLSYNGARKQVYAGIISQFAEALYWDQIVDPITGATLNPNFLDHKFPTPLDTNQDRYQAKLVESDDACGPYGAKGIGEPVITSFGCFANAIYNATGKWVKEAPAYPWRILKAMGKV